MVIKITLKKILPNSINFTARKKKYKLISIWNANCKSKFYSSDNLNYVLTKCKENVQALNIMPRTRKYLNLRKLDDAEFLPSILNYHPNFVNSVLIFI
jgi:hypothetical protein